MGQRHHSRGRSGLTVVEVLVALMLVAIGMLGMAGTAALALRSATENAGRRAAAHRTATRLSMLEALGCARAASGAVVDSTTHATERWTVAPAAAGFATVTDTLSWMTSRGQRSLGIESAFEC